VEFESEVRLFGSPGASVVIGSRGWPLLGAAALGFAVGLGISMVACRRRRGHGARRGPERQRWREAMRAPMRLPSDNPDVETEL
jgi:hypothetical protein